MAVRGRLCQDEGFPGVWNPFDPARSFQSHESSKALGTVMSMRGSGRAWWECARIGVGIRQGMRMDRRPILLLVLAFELAGCAQPDRRLSAGKVDHSVVPAVHQVEETPAQRPLEAETLSPARMSADLLVGPQPVEAYIAVALRENRTVQAAYHNVQSLKHRVPQAVALEDPYLSNTIFPIPSVAPQYSLMGYNPYNFSLAQQFPWFGTLRLRGETAARDVQVALAELAAAQLDAVAAVKRAYYSLHASVKTREILRENRTILEDFREVARERLRSGGTQQDVLRAEVLLNELDRELATAEQGIAQARAALARQIHARADSDLATVPELPRLSVPRELERLEEIAASVRPEIQGRLAAVARDEKAVELAQKRYYPNVTLGLAFMDMTKSNAATPATAAGAPNVGLFVGLNLPIHHKKYDAGVLEARERALADAKLYEAQRDLASSEIQDLLAQARAEERTLDLLRDAILPRTKRTLELARGDYAKGNVDYATVQSALREVLQIQLQITQSEAELARDLAALERAVGAEIAGPAETPPQR